MALPFHIACAALAPPLYERADGRFQIVQDLPLTPFLAGYQYLLVDEMLGIFLRKLDPPLVRYGPAVVFNPVTGAEIHSFLRVYADHVFEPTRIETLPLDGMRLFRMGNDHYFVSLGLKARLKRRWPGVFRFSKGLSQFA
jgi:hypothetical protein